MYSCLKHSKPLHSRSMVQLWFSYSIQYTGKRLPIACDMVCSRRVWCLGDIVQHDFASSSTTLDKIMALIMSPFNSSWPHAFVRIMARQRRAAHGPNSRGCWSPGEPARVQPPFPQDIWTLSCSVIRLALIGAGVLVRIWSISNNYPYQNNIKTTFSPWINRYKCSISIRHRITEWPTCNLHGYSIAKYRSNTAHNIRQIRR